MNKTNIPEWLTIAQQLQSIAQAGLTYTENKYDVDRYQQIQTLSISILHHYSEIPEEKIRDIFNHESGYQTPKVDVRGVVFRDNKILMVKESIDGRWSIPGGWADVCLSPFEIARKEIFEESSLQIKPIRLLAVLDKRKHPHPPEFWHAYKLFVLCQDQGGNPKPGMETLDTDFFSQDNIPELSEARITLDQIQLMFSFLHDPSKQTVCE